MKYNLTPRIRLGASPLRSRGFTIIELMIVVVITAVLVSLAYPSYQSSIRKSRRSEAMTALTNILQAQERHRSTNAAFTTLITEATTASPPGLGQPALQTPSGYYTLSISGASATGYTATAAAVTSTSQGADGPCVVLSVQMNAGNIRYGAGATVATVDWTDPQRCWAR